MGACRAPTPSSPTLSEYFAPEPVAVQTGGVHTLEIETTKGPHRIWTKRVGNHPRIKLLLLQGGPGCSHEYWECLESFLPAEGIEFIYYDQLDTGFSDHPGDPDLWEVPRPEELLKTHFYTAHVSRLPLDRWPEPMTRSFNGL